MIPPDIRLCSPLGYIYSPSAHLWFNWLLRYQQYVLDKVHLI